MAKIRKTLRDSLISVLGNPSNGFNPTLAAIAADYGITPFAIDWTTGSKNLFCGFLPAGQIEISEIAEYPAFVVYTSNAENRHTNKPKTFSGPVVAHVDVYVKFTTGAEQHDTESVCEAIEDAIITCIERDSAAWPPSVGYTGQYTGFWTPITLLSNGWERIIPIEMLFEVNA